MKRHLKSTIAGLGFAAICLAGSGCSLLGTAVPVSNDGLDGGATSDARPATGSSDPFSTHSEIEERQQWSRLIKEGREHLQMGRNAAAEQSLLTAFRLSKDFRRSDVRRQVSFGNLERLAGRYRVARNDAAAIRVLRIIANETTSESEFSYAGLSNLLLDLAQLLQRDEELEDANFYYRRALDLRIQKSGPNSSTLIEIYQRLSRLEISREHHEKAAVYAESSLELSEATFGQDSAELISARLHAASAYYETRRYAESEEQYQSCIESQRDSDPTSIVEAIARNGLALVYLDTDRLDDGLAQVDLALSILEELEVGSTSRAIFLDTKAQILAADGKSESASQVFDEVMDRSKDASPSERKTLYLSFESFLKDQNRPAEAQEIRQQIEELGGLPDSLPESPPVEAQRSAETAEVSAAPGDPLSAP